MASIKDIRNRIKSIESTRQITKAMELVASSKMRRAKERAEQTRAFFNLLYETVTDIAANEKELSSPYLERREIRHSLFVIIGAERGLAGGYTANLVKTAEKAMRGKNPVLVCIGKKAIERFEKSPHPMIASYPSAAEDLSVHAAASIAERIADGYMQKEFDEVVVVYTNFISALSQQPVALPVLPLAPEERGEAGARQAEPVIYEPSAEAVFHAIVPQYLAGVLYGCVCESYVSEQAARKSAMNAANDNADEMLEGLQLEYNRARQSAITQEITEIVAGAQSASA